MPIYEYRCEKGHTFEVMQRMTDEPVLSCETCAAPVERVFHPVAVHFKGSGFYNTDYGTKRRPKDSGEDSKVETKQSETKEDSKSESKSSDSKAAASSSSSG
jgi:putative FmdB family regulatory protein